VVGTAEFEVAPVAAPHQWLFPSYPSSFPDYGFTFLLPPGVPVQFRTTPPGCGIWWKGIWVITPSDPPPVDPTILKATEGIGEECPG
jgi:hypothetical protein